MSVENLITALKNELNMYRERAKAKDAANIKLVRTVKQHLLAMEEMRKDRTALIEQNAKLRRQVDGLENRLKRTMQKD